MPELVRRAVTHRGKCIICGDSTVGKSALTQVYCSDGAQYPKTYSMTTGVDLTVKNISIPESSGDTVEMFLYDTAGKEEFGDTVEAHLKDAPMVVFMYDVTCETSFKNIALWHKKFDDANNGKSIVGVLVGNKSDLVERQVISSELGEEMATKFGLKFFQCSAKDMMQVDSPFLYLAKEFHSKQSEQ